MFNNQNHDFTGRERVSDEIIGGMTGFINYQNQIFDPFNPNLNSQGDKRSKLDYSQPQGQNNNFLLSSQFDINRGNNTALKPEDYIHQNSTSLNSTPFQNSSFPPYKIDNNNNNNNNTLWNLRRRRNNNSAMNNQNQDEFYNYNNRINNNNTFESSNNEENDDDYDENEDLRKNFRKYKDDEEWQYKNKIIVPKSEVNALIADQKRNLEENYPPMNNLSSGQRMISNDMMNFNSDVSMVGRKRQSGAVANIYDQQSYGGYASNISNRQQQMTSVGQQANKRWKVSTSATVQTGYNQSTQMGDEDELRNPRLQSQYHQDPTSNFKGGMIDQSSQIRPQASSRQNSLINTTEAQQTRQQAAAANLQNNFYYNSNNNFGGGSTNPNLQNQVDSKQSITHAAGQQNTVKQVKSIEIQVSPEKLEGNNSSMSGAQDQQEDKGGKKKRRRRKQADKYRTQNEMTADVLLRGVGVGAWTAQGYPSMHNNVSTPFYNMGGGPTVQGGFGPGQQQFMNQPKYFPMPFGSAPTPYTGYPTTPFGGQYQPYGTGKLHSFPLQQQNNTFPPNILGGGSNSQNQYSEDSKSKDMLRDYLRTMFFPFQNDHLKELISQIEIYIQMLYQVLLYPSPNSPDTHDFEEQQSIIHQNDSRRTTHKKDSNSQNSLTKDQDKYRAYCLLYDFQSKKEQTLKPLSLPLYDVPLASIRPQKEVNQRQVKGKKQSLTKEETLENNTIAAEESLVLKLNPQVSFFQSPLLEIAPEIIKQLSKNANNSAAQYMKKEEQIKAASRFMKQFEPLINPHLLPITRNYYPYTTTTVTNRINNHHQYYHQQQNNKKDKSQDNYYEEEKNESQMIYDEDDFDNYDDMGKQSLFSNPNINGNNRRKFSLVDDNFLLMGLRQFGYKEVEAIKNAWLPNKHHNEIKHRYKNLTCAKASDNIIKRWKYTHNIPLTDYEEKQLARAVRWFGPSTTNRWSLISKCYLPNRSPMFLKLEYQNIVQDHKRAERFGKLILDEDLSEDLDDQQSGADGKCKGKDKVSGKFEDIDLDNLQDQEDEEEAALLDEYMAMGINREKKSHEENSHQSIQDSEQGSQLLYERTRENNMDDNDDHLYEEVEL